MRVLISGDAEAIGEMLVKLLQAMVDGIDKKPELKEEEYDDYSAI